MLGISLQLCDAVAEREVSIVLEAIEETQKLMLRTPAQCDQVACPGFQTEMYLGNVDETSISHSRYMPWLFLSSMTVCFL